MSVPPSRYDGGGSISPSDRGRPATSPTPAASVTASSGNVSDTAEPPGGAENPTRPHSEPMTTDLLAAELGILMATDRRLTASEERRRSWLVRELAEREQIDGRAELRALIVAWDSRYDPTPTDLETT